MINQSTELSLEQEFRLKSFADQVRCMSREQAQEFLIMIHQQMMIQETMYQHFYPLILSAYRKKLMAIFSKLIPIPEPIQNKSSVSHLKKRLDWGEPALTIIDVRTRESFNMSHIRGSIPMPMDEPAALTLASLSSSRDIYVYAETDEQTAVAANQLRQADYQNVSELIGGLTAWKKAKYPIEGWWSMPVEKS